MKAKHIALATMVVAAAIAASNAARATSASSGTLDPGIAAADFVALFNGRDLAGWKIPAGDNGHWRVVES